MLAEVIEMIDEGILIDRSVRPIRPIATLVASARDKSREDDVRAFVREFWKRYPHGRLVLSKKSHAEKVAAEMAELLEVPVEIVEPAKRGAWDADPHILDERIVGRASHVVAFDESARSQNYKKLAARTNKHFSTV